MFSTVQNTQRFTELGREEKGEGGDRGDLVEKKENPNGERAIRPAISLPSKNGNEDWVLIPKHVWYFCPISHPRLVGLGTVGSGLLHTLARSQIPSSFSSIGVMHKPILFKMLF